MRLGQQGARPWPECRANARGTLERLGWRAVLPELNRTDRLRIPRLQAQKELVEITSDVLPAGCATDNFDQRQMQVRWNSAKREHSAQVVTAHDRRSGTQFIRHVGDMRVEAAHHVIR